ncbi:methylosome protein 50-like [Anopheles marshallii]|uniref:methylosome protein 50-like n=1 Tax=Anopheles marshallii TaxID=1521116 RepID=UPI00237A4BB5|nr:methylosome protein 50-like [Anopheles marshallii]
MDYSKRVDMIATYSVPPTYHPPVTLSELAKSTDYPNMNSVQYRLTEAVPLPDKKLPPFLDLATVNEAGNVIVAGNNYTGRLWDGAFCGWQKVEDLFQEEKVTFSKQCDAIITALAYTMDDALFLLGNDKGSIELWSTGNAVRGPGLYLVDKQNQHIGVITALDKFQSTERTVISGSMDGCIILWDSSQGDLQSTTRLQHAHLGAITSIATDSSQDSLAVSCSNDRSALMWDFRELKPGVALYEKHDVPFTTIRWCSDSDWNRLVAIGDEAGRVYFIDTRQPNVFLETLECFDRKVHKISFHRKHFAVLGNTPEVKFYNNKSKEIRMENSASNYVRDIIWGETNGDGISCTLIGWDSYTKQLSLNE